MFVTDENEKKGEGGSDLPGLGFVRLRLKVMKAGMIYDFITDQLFIVLFCCPWMQKQLITICW